MKLSDPIDQASHLADLHNAASIREQARKAAPEQQQRQVTQEDGTVALVWDTEDCVDCGDEIEKQRLAHGKVRCYSCQVAKEKRDAHFARR